MRKVDDIKIKRTRAPRIISLLTLSNWKFSLGCFLGESHEILTNIGFEICRLKERQGFLFLHYSRSKSGEGGITWSVCKYMNCKQIKHGQDFSEIASTVVKVKVKVVSIGLSPTIKFVWQHRCSNIGHKRPKLLKNWELQACRLTRVGGSVKHVYIVHVLARVLYTRASTCVYARARTQ